MTRRIYELAQNDKFAQFFIDKQHSLLVDRAVIS